MNQIGQGVGPDYLSRLNSSIRSAVQLARRDLLNINDFTEGVRLHAQKLPKILRINIFRVYQIIKK